MTTFEIELWQMLTAIGAVVAAGMALLFGFGQVLLAQIEQRLAARHEQVTRHLDTIEAAGREEAGRIARVERELLEMKADLPMRFVQRDDYIRGQSVLEAKMDSLALKLENVQLRSAASGGKHHVD